MVSFKVAALKVRNLLLKKKIESLKLLNMSMENELSFLQHELIEVHSVIASLRAAAAAEAAARRASATERQRRRQQGRGRGRARGPNLNLVISDRARKITKAGQKTAGLESVKYWAVDELHTEGHVDDCPCHPHHIVPLKRQLKWFNASMSKQIFSWFRGQANTFNAMSPRTAMSPLTHLVYVLRTLGVTMILFDRTTLLISTPSGRKEGHSEKEDYEAPGDAPVGTITAALAGNLF